MTKIYVVEHENVEEECIEDIRVVGIYSSEKLAQEAIERTKKLPGFSKYPEGFQVTNYILDQDNFAFGFIYDAEFYHKNGRF